MIAVLVILAGVVLFEVIATLVICSPLGDRIWGPVADLPEQEVSDVSSRS